MVVVAVAGAGARRAVSLIFAGWVPQDRVSSQSPLPSNGCHRPLPPGRLPIDVSRMLCAKALAAAAATNVCCDSGD